MLVAVCLKWVDLRPEIDPVSGVVTTDSRTHGLSPADETALELALRLAEADGGRVLACTAGPSAAEGALRAALAAGAHEGVRVDVPADSDSSWVAAALFDGLVGGEGTPDRSEDAPSVVVFGAYSLDRGSGSVPAFVADHLGWAQALGLVSVDIHPVAGAAVAIHALRRLDGGRREDLEVVLPAVVSVEGAATFAGEPLRLRRAPLSGMLAAGSAGSGIRVVEPSSVGHRPLVSRAVPRRPRARHMPGPGGQTAFDRVVTLTGSLAAREAARTVEAGPTEAAEAILEQLRSWGYELPDGSDPGGTG